jgi:uncharacterized membrane protein
MPLGPVQILIVGFDEPNFTGKIREELARLREADIVRLVDLLVIYKHEDGSIERLQQSDLSEEELEEFGAYVGALIGLGAAGEEGMEAGAELGVEAIQARGDGDSDAWYADDAIPPGSAAAIALLEHRWAIPLRDAIREANGFSLADAWIHPEDLVAIGLMAAEEEAAQS